MLHVTLRLLFRKKGDRRLGSGAGSPEKRDQWLYPVAGECLPGGLRPVTGFRFHASSTLPPR